MGDVEMNAEATVTIINELGLHARAATLLVKLAGTFPCDVTIEKDGQEVSAKSIMGVLMLVASQGSIITLRAAGERSGEAIASLVELIADRFGEEK